MRYAAAGSTGWVSFGITCRFIAVTARRTPRVIHVSQLLPICVEESRKAVSVGYFRVVAEGSQLAQPIEKIVATAVEAEAQSDAFRRQCGRSGKVEVWGKNGRIISPDALRSLVKIETAAGQ